MKTWWLTALIALTSLSAFAAEPEVQLSSDAQDCARLLNQAHSMGLAKQLQGIVWDAQFIEAAITSMKEKGEITSAHEEQKVRAQLTLGAFFNSEGLLHEAVYTVFKARYNRDREIKDALNSFKHISESSDKALLLSEVIEKVLQFIPDVDVDNVNQIKEIAQYINMNETQLENFRNKWMVYDQSDDFVEILQGGILAVLLSPSPDFIEQVLERGSLKYGFRRKMWKISLPTKPTAKAEVTSRQVEIEEKEYYPDEELLSYLKTSSSAATRFFIGDRLKYLTMSQISKIIKREKEFWLKASLVKILERELVWRQELARRYEVVKGYLADKQELEISIARLENRMPYDPATFQKRVNALRNLEDAQEALAEAKSIIDEYSVKCDSQQLVNVVSSVVTATAAKLRDHGRLTISLVEKIVDTSNLTGLLSDHAVKISRILGDLAGKLNSSAVIDANAMVKKLNVITPKYANLNLEQLRAEFEKVLISLIQAEKELEQVYQRRPGI